ncbi:hypothetical protein [Pinirhizobacter sp.]|jgi:hypothetical protein|uniref:hypothetical protein n=1 Tax=Pinirhizobacter sp. TaxID=2950432 RepID=UPI002F42C918
MEQFQFGPGEEKLAKAFEMLVTLQRGLLLVHARADVDTMLIGALLQSHPNLTDVFDEWKAMSSQYLPGTLLAQASGSDFAEAEAEKARRSGFWTGLLQQLMQDDG